MQAICLKSCLLGNYNLGCGIAVQSSSKQFLAKAYSRILIHIHLPSPLSVTLNYASRTCRYCECLGDLLPQAASLLISSWMSLHTLSICAACLNHRDVQVLNFNALNEFKNRIQLGMFHSHAHKAVLSISVTRYQALKYIDYFQKYAHCAIILCINIPSILCVCIFR